mgnify:CR=1 FL=1
MTHRIRSTGTTARCERNGSQDIASLHQGILAFLSDFKIMANSLMPHGISILNKQLQPASLDHTIWFHDDFIVDDWLLYQLNCDRTGSSRGLTRGYFFERSGKLVASTIQEGLMRIRE